VDEVPDILVLLKWLATIELRRHSVLLTLNDTAEAKPYAIQRWPQRRWLLCEQYLGEQARIAHFECGSFYEQDKDSPGTALRRKLQNRLARISTLPFNPF
jgi:hypothetical protein